MRLDGDARAEPAGALPAVRILREAASWTQTAADVELEDLLGVTRAENHADGAQRPDWSRLGLLPSADLQKPKPATLWTTTPPRKSWPTSNRTLPITGRSRNTPTPTPFSHWSRTDPSFQTAAVS